MLLWAMWGASRAELVPVAGAAIADRLCPVLQSETPRETVVEGCAKAWCTAAGTRRLCMCQSSGADGAPRHRYLLDGRASPAEVSPMTGPAAFDVTQADVDGDGIADLLVEQFMAQSNGLGVRYGRLCVWASRGGAADCRDVQEWGSLSVLVREPGRQACSLVDAAWLPGRERGRGDGTYAFGRVLRFERAAWRGVGSRAPVARRLFSSFARQREDLPVLNAQRLWYQHPQARAVRCPDPLCAAAAAR